MFSFQRKTVSLCYQVVPSGDALEDSLEHPANCWQVACSLDEDDRWEVCQWTWRKTLCHCHWAEVPWNEWPWLGQRLFPYNSVLSEVAAEESEMNTSVNGPRFYPPCVVSTLSHIQHPTLTHSSNVFFFFFLALNKKANQIWWLNCICKPAADSLCCQLTPLL